ncbi:TCP-1/cpn60 chaperonin family protein [Streptomyces sp. NPDC006997]|uniref:TCP-1/cpn60 chaperonin family protein n=1 Tax=Streptomyces sp. NPDC006997 TaxID=3155356 RepID=UPI0033EF4820
MTSAAPAPDGGFEAVTRPTAGMQSVQDSQAVLAAAARRVARLERDGTPAATGFLVGPALLLTAGHAVRLDLGASGAAPVAGLVAVFDHRDGTGLPPAEGGVRVPLVELLASSPPATDDPEAPGVPRAPDGLDFALVRLARHPHHADGPADHYRLLREEYAFGSGVLHVFHHSQRWALDDARTTYDRRTADGRRVRYGGTNTVEGSSGGPVVTQGGALVALHHGHRGTVNEGVPTRLIAERVLAGPHAGLLRRTFAPPPARPASPGVTAIGRAMGALLGPWRADTTVYGPAGEPVRVATARAVAEHFRHSEPPVDLVAEAARAMDVRVGDGAVTAAVLTAALIREADARCAAGTAPGEVARGAAAALQRARAALVRLARPCAHPGAVARAATADRRLADAVAEAALLAGPDGVLLCEPGATREIEAPVPRQGLRLPAGHAAPFTADAPGTDPWTRRTRLVRPYVLLLDEATGDGETFRRLRGRIGAEGRPLLVLAAADPADPRAALLRGLADPADGPVPTVVRLPGPYGHRLGSLAVLTGATALTEGSGLLPGTAWFDVLGRADLAVVSGSDTVLVGGGHDPAAVRRWTASARARHALATSDAERAALDEQLAWLTSRSVTLPVGADTAADLARRTARAERVARSAQAALRSGTLPGGGLALLRARAALPPPPTDPGTDAVRAALGEPHRLLTGTDEPAVEPPSGARDEDAADASHDAADASHDAADVPQDAAEVVLGALDAASAALAAYLRTV